MSDVEFSKIMSDWNPEHADSLDDVWELASYMKSCFGDYFHSQTRRLERGGPREIRYLTIDKSWSSRWFQYRNPDWRLDPSGITAEEREEIEAHVERLLSEQRKD